MPKHDISEKEKMRILFIWCFFKKSINVIPTRVKMAEHAKNKEAHTNVNVPQSFKDVTVQQVRIVYFTRALINGSVLTFITTAILL